MLSYVRVSQGTVPAAGTQTQQSPFRGFEWHVFHSVAFPAIANAAFLDVPFRPMLITIDDSGYFGEKNILSNGSMQ